MEKLVQLQEETGLNIAKLLDNTKKEPIERRTEESIKKREEKLKAFWEKFQAQHEEIIRYNQPTHAYFANNYYAQVESAKNNVQELLKSYTEALMDKSPADETNNNKQKLHVTSQFTPENESRRLLSYKKQQVKIESLTDLLKQVKINEANLTMISYYEKLLTESWAGLNAVHEEILLQSETEDYDTRGFQTAMTQYDDIKAKYWEYIVLLQEKKHTMQISPAPEHEVRLPRLTIPTFDGKYESWTAFHDIFCRLIHDNKKLADIEKLQYLKTNLRGEAYRLLSHIEISEVNYNTAWEMLNNRFNNKRKLISTQIQSLMAMTKVDPDSATGIKKLHDNTKEYLYALANLGVDTKSWAPIIAHIIIQKLDAESHKLYEQSLENPREPPTFDAIYKFLENRFQSLEALKDTKRKENIAHYKNESGRYKFRNYYNSYESVKCQYCQSSHQIYTCLKFKTLIPNKRKEFIIQNKLCINCLNHNELDKCQSQKRCTICREPHHTMLHQAYKNFNRPPNRSMQPSTKSGAPNIQTHFSEQGFTVLLATAIVKAKTVNGYTEYLRALIDPGSQASLISESSAQLLALPRTKIHASITGMGEAQAGVARSRIYVEIQPRFPSSFRLHVGALVLPKLTRLLPNHRITTCDKKWTKEHIADPTYDIPGPIDLIIGADVYGKIILDGIHKEDSGLLAQRTELGWIFSGQSQGIVTKQITSLISHVDIEDQLHKFWEIEEVDSHTEASEEDKVCEQHYQQTHRRNSDGSYTVKIPFKDEQLMALGNSRRQAMARLLQNERKFMNNKQLRIDYQKFMDEYIALGHMIPAKPQTTEGYYLPHQAVIKADSSTTKLRVVFDASMKTTNGVSLNDVMYAGPRLQNDLVSILLRWRKYRYVIAADIEKMYRQIKADPDDYKYQKILWRSSPSEPIKEYYLTTVTYGTTCAPFLALRTLRQLALDEKDRFPAATKILSRDFYVDDLITGADTLYDAKSIQQDLINLLNAGHFKLRKWTSNRRELLEHIPEELREIKMLNLGEHEVIKTLGVHWNPVTDNFQFCINMPQRNSSSTKRAILSDISKIFDPLGWLCPVITYAKILMQEIWASAVDWDQQVPSDIEKKWSKFKEELPQIETIRIPRWIRYKPSNLHIELHGFCDASEKAYAAAIYSRIITEQGDIIITLLTAKTKVAPIKRKLTIPRLELCAAVLLTNLMSKTITTLELQNAQVHMWSDSSITLAWINGEPHQWKSFVSHRVAEIRSKTDTKQWYYVASEENPADCASRGLCPAQIKRHKLWWTGPQWLNVSKEEWPLTTLKFQTKEEKRKNSYLTHVTTETSTEIIERYSSLTTLYNVFAYCNRFINKCRRNSHQQHNFLTVSELRNGELQIIRLVQASVFKKEIECIKLKKQLPAKSKLLSLAPFVDDEGIMRVGGRLQNSLLSFNEKHPIILPHDHHFTKLIIHNAHKVTLHGGNQMTLAYLRRKFWIIKAKSTIRSIIYSCVQCCRYNATTSQQAMGNLPSQRVTPSRPFNQTGVDYAGPFLIKTSKLRGAKTHKAYVCLFICVATKAIHIELVSDLTTEAFLAALKRMTARRGSISDIYSDCGTNFIGASKELERRHSAILRKIQEDVANKISQDGIQWHFNPPAAPHFGGIWEAGVKSTKYHLKRILGNVILTFEELTTVLYQIEACLNSRPLCSMSNDPNDLSAITPGHFLIGDALVTPPQLTTPDFLSHQARWKLVSKLHNDFWTSWSTEYLSRLQQRPKWQVKQDNVNKGDIVLVKGENMPPSKWPLARIIDTHPGEDGLVRVVTLKTEQSTIKRPITKICKLPVDDPTIKSSEIEVKAHMATLSTQSLTKIKDNNEIPSTKLTNVNKESPTMTQTRKIQINKITGKRKPRIQPAYGYSNLISPEEQQRLANKRKERDALSSHKQKRVKPNTTLAFSNTTLLCLVLLFLTSLAAGSYNVTYPEPGLYIEHIGDVKIQRGTLRLELNFPLNITEDTDNVHNTINKMEDICKKTKEFSQEIHCNALVQQLRQKQVTLLGELEVLKNSKQNRSRRGIIGRILQSLFGVNEEVYLDIDALKQNQEVLRHMTHHQSTLLLSSLTRINDTQVRTLQKINMVTAKLNKVITEVNKVQGWFTDTDHNKINIHILSAHQLANELINDLEQHYVKIVQALLARGSIFDFVSPRQLTEIIKNATAKIPPDLQILHQPSERVEITMDDTTLTVFGFLRITEIKKYTLDKTTPIPQRTGNDSYVSPEISSPIIATNYDSQTYFTLTEAELAQCIKQDQTLLCAPTVVSNMETNPNCVVDEIYHRANRKPCQFTKLTTPTITWKHLYMRNTWLFIFNQPLPVAIKCNGIREDIVLNGTGIIKIDQGCSIQTRKNTLISESVSTIPVKATFIKPMDFNLSNIEYLSQTRINQLDAEPILRTSDLLSDINEPRMIQAHSPSTTWKNVGHHATTGISSVTVTIILLLIYKFRGKLTAIHIRSRPHSSTAPQPQQITPSFTSSTLTALPAQCNLDSSLKHHLAQAVYSEPAECSHRAHATINPEKSTIRNP